MTGMSLVYGFLIFVYYASVSSLTKQDSSISEDLEDVSEKNCSELSNLYLKCPDYDANQDSCTYGEWMTVNCTPGFTVNCQGPKNVTKRARCVFCYQTEKWEYSCDRKSSCISGQNKLFRFNCTVHKDVMCLGPRTFEMKLRWNCTRGHKWSTALILSITLGGFGADRFYLGHWQEGIGKLFSFGGLGVWTLVDVLLIAIRYLGPADGSFYV